MAEQITITAGPRSLTATIATGVVGSTKLRRWESPPPKAKRRTAPGRYGSRPLGPADYEDRQWTLEVERVPEPGDTAVDSEAWLQSWEELAGLANELSVDQAAVPVLARTAANGEVISFLASEVQIDPVGMQQSTLWHRGHARAKVTVTTEGIGRGALQSVTGSLSVPSTGLNRTRPVWQSSAAIPGDLAPEAIITATFSEKRRQAVAQVLDGDGVVFAQGSWRNFGISITGVNGALNSTVAFGMVRAVGVAFPWWR